MSTARIILLAVGAGLFAYWAYAMFRTLFLIRRRGTAQTGAAFPGPRTALKGWAEFLRNPQNVPARNRLIGATGAMIVWIALSATLPT